MRGRHPEILVAADASDPAATGGAAAALSGIVNVAIRETLTVRWQPARVGHAISVTVHREYNPRGYLDQHRVPGLPPLLSMTMVDDYRRRHRQGDGRGTMEMLIATPVRPLE